VVRSFGECVVLGRRGCLESYVVSFVSKIGFWWLNLGEEALRFMLEVEVLTLCSDLL
jgi:hypothetical protein